nr:MAG TPA: hypothetical protein [Caudoviricetes sp.]
MLCIKVLIISLVQSVQQMLEFMCFIKQRTLGTGIWAMVGISFNHGVLLVVLEKTHLFLKRSDVSDDNNFYKAAIRRPFFVSRHSERTRGSKRELKVLSRLLKRQVVFYSLN